MPPHGLSRRETTHHQLGLSIPPVFRTPATPNPTVRETGGSAVPQCGSVTQKPDVLLNGPDLPVPTVVAIGRAFGVGYAISERHFGRFLEDVRAEESLRSAPMLGSLLGALRTIEERPNPSDSRQSADLAPHDSWRDFLVARVTDDGTSRNAGWRAALRRSVIQAMDAGHLRPDTDPGQLVAELNGMAMALLHDARFLRDTHAAQHAQATWQRMLASYRT